MNPTNKPRIFVVGNEKGGAGKTTCSMHIIGGLMDRGFKVASIDTDIRQRSLTSYIENRKEYNQKNPDKPVPSPSHHVLEEEDCSAFENLIREVAAGHDYVIIDTPGSHSALSRMAHSYADVIVTPINDSFVDFDVMAKINPDDYSIASPSIYSQTVWDQKINRASRDNGSIEWIVVRNRLGNLDAVNKRNMEKALGALSKRIGFKIAPGFSERVIFRELFPRGLTLLDLTKAAYDKPFSASHVAARQELREFLKACGI